jgi:RNA polymerase sigma factor (sigma-70 family)
MVGLAQSLARGRVDAEDLAQDVFERWLRSVPHPRVEAANDPADAAPASSAVANPQAWMALVLRRLLIDRLRRQSRELVLHRIAPPVTASADERDSKPWWAELDPSAIEHELGRLPPALRETFRLFTFKRRSYAQIARELAIAPATVGTRISRARALLKQRLTARAG